jgi:hypothetical protein
MHKFGTGLRYTPNILFYIILLHHLSARCADPEKYTEAGVATAGAPAC